MQINWIFLLLLNKEGNPAVENLNYSVSTHLHPLLSISVCLLYLDVSNPFTTFTVTISGQVFSLRHDPSVGFQFCGYFKRSINTTAVISCPTKRYRVMMLGPM